jgi:FAD:protein FMN transferase
MPAEGKELVEPIRRSFRTMGTKVELVLRPSTGAKTAARLLRKVEAVFAEQDARFSRFRPESELSRVNAEAGRWVRVSRPFAELTRRALEAARETDGLFDPTVLPSLRAVGYDRDFCEVRSIEAGDDEELRSIRRDLAHLMIKNPTACGAWRGVELNGDRVRLPKGAALDVGGIAKGWTVDLAAARLPGVPWAIIDAGGDLRIVGTPPPPGLDVGVEDPHDRDCEALRLRLASGALATTSVTVRAWGPGLHHVIDPRTSRPASTGVVQATVWAPTCTEAEVWSKAALLGGPPILDRIPAALVSDSGQILTNFELEPGMDGVAEVVA